MGLDAEFHDHGRVFSSKVGFTAFDGLCFHGGICGVTISFVVWEITRRCVTTELGHCNCIRFYHCSDSWIATAEFYQGIISLMSIFYLKDWVELVCKKTYTSWRQLISILVMVDEIKSKD